MSDAWSGASGPPRQAAGVPARQPDPRPGRPGLPFGQRPRQLSTLTLRAAAAQSRTDPTSVVIERISEQIQPDDVLMRRLAAAQVLPGSALYVTGLSDGVEVWQEGAEHTALDRLTAEHVFVTAA